MIVAESPSDRCHQLSAASAQRLQAQTLVDGEGNARNSFAIEQFHLWLCGSEFTLSHNGWQASPGDLPQSYANISEWQQIEAEGKNLLPGHLKTPRRRREPDRLHESSSKYQRMECEVRNISSVRTATKPYQRQWHHKKLNQVRQKKALTPGA